MKITPAQHDSLIASLKDDGWKIRKRNPAESPEYMVTYCYPPKSLNLGVDITLMFSYFADVTNRDHYWGGFGQHAQLDMQLSSNEDILKVFLEEVAYEANYAKEDQDRRNNKNIVKISSSHDEKVVIQDFFLEKGCPAIADWLCEKQSIRTTNKKTQKLLSDMSKELMMIAGIRN